MKRPKSQMLEPRATRKTVASKMIIIRDQRQFVLKKDGLFSHTETIKMCKAERLKLDRPEREREREFINC